MLLQVQSTEVEGRDQCLHDSCAKDACERVCEEIFHC